MGILLVILLMTGEDYPSQLIRGHDILKEILICPFKKRLDFATAAGKAKAARKGRAEAEDMDEHDEDEDGLRDECSKDMRALVVQLEARIRTLEHQILSTAVVQRYGDMRNLIINACQDYITTRMDSPTVGPHPVKQMFANVILNATLTLKGQRAGPCEVGKMRSFRCSDPRAWHPHLPRGDPATCWAAPRGRSQDPLKWLQDALRHTDNVISETLLDKSCAGVLDVEGWRSFSLINAIYNTPGEACTGSVEVTDWTKVVAKMGGRSYFGDMCSRNGFDPSEYVAVNILGKTIRMGFDGPWTSPARAAGATAPSTWPPCGRTPTSPTAGRLLL
ncbi:unnamed protein product [Prorocentrum cordatum]|uniref:Uncharacterized protein n=1 Tax=Prorocentrum cordatum TaxID=2364126 RepID=A0ABN9TNZ7_9DINO|nr:unnamed protein product [Polarella glacialis]